MHTNSKDVPQINLFNALGKFYRRACILGEEICAETTAKDVKHPLVNEEPGPQLRF